MSLKEKILEDVKTAMKAKNQIAMTTLRLLRSEIKKREIDQKKDFADPDILKLISSLIKQRNDSIKAFQEGNRADLVEKEQEEISVLQVYLPKQLSESELDSLVTACIEESGATSIKDMGKVMQSVLAKVAGKADGRIVSELVKTKLAGK